MSILGVPVDELFFPRDFAFCSLAFAAVMGFCIGGTALSNVIGIAYINKRLSLKNSVRMISMKCEF
jgi:hypothetical protein